MQSSELDEIKNRISKADVNARGRRIYPKRLKSDIVAYARRNNKDLGDLSQDTGICVQTLTPWITKHKSKSDDEFGCVKIKDNGSEPSPSLSPKAKKTDAKVQTPLLPNGFMVLGDVKSVADFIRRVHAPASL